MRRPVLGAVLCLLAQPAFNESRAAETEKPRGVLAVWDTGVPAGAALDAGLTGKNNWTALPPGKTTDVFQGDAALSNGRVAMVLRKQDAALEIHAVKPEGAIARMRLRLLTASGEPAAQLRNVALVENARGSATLEATFTTGGGATISGKFRVKRGEVTVQVEPRSGAGKLRVECPGRFTVLPDFFADDITLDATRLPLEMVELPSDNFVLQPTAGGDAMALCIFESRRHDVRATLAGSGEQRVVTGTEIGFEGKKVWVALLEAPQIWHALEVTPADAGKVMPLSWKMPFPAQWRVDFTRPNDLTESWEMLLKDKKGDGYLKPTGLGGGAEHFPGDRKAYHTVLGGHAYPCWSDADGRGYLQPFKFTNRASSTDRKLGVPASFSNAELQFQGPVLMYPINRVQQTPLDAYTVVDVMRNTLGVGPCEHILGLEGRQSEYKGRATCGVRDTLNPIYDSNQQKQKRAEIDKVLDEGLVFVKHIRGRITRYVEFGHKMRQYLAEQKKAHPELAGFIDEMDRFTAEIDNRVAVRAANIQTPAYVAKMNEDFRKNVLDYNGADAKARCRSYTEALVVIGNNQDKLSAECRWAVKTLRQRAGIRVALDPRAAPMAAEIRTRAQQAMRNPANHEQARH